MLNCLRKKRKYKNTINIINRPLAAPAEKRNKKIVLCHHALILYIKHHEVKPMQDIK